MKSRYDPDHHHRRSIRLKGYDYAQAGAYFVTICTHNRACLFGDIVDDSIRLNDAGQLVQEVWTVIPTQHPGIAIDEFVVMPNHIHAIIMIASTTTVGAQFIAPHSAPHSGSPGPPATIGTTGTAGAMNHAPTVGAIVRAYKARVTVAINQRQGTRGVPVWQRNFYEHIIRDDDTLDRIRQYIVDNPAQWAHDPENTSPAGGTR
jgi:REP element-mobilizing transposase RayT